MSSCSQIIRFATFTTVLCACAVSPLTAIQTRPCAEASFLLHGERVLAAHNHIPLRDALVTITWRSEGRERSVAARTDSTGRAQLCVPAHDSLRVQAQYRDVAGPFALIQLHDVTRSEHTMLLDVRASGVTPDAVPLPPLVVTATSRRLDAVGFYDREKRGIGTFIGRDQVDAARVQFTSELLRSVPGVRLLTPNARRDAPRSYTMGRGGCRFRFVVDGTRVQPDFELDMIAPLYIEGIEVYAGLAQVPAIFRPQAADGAGATCGVIAVWTRNGR